MGTLDADELPYDCGCLLAVSGKSCGGCGTAAWLAQYVSLACRPGKLVVRAVWKLLKKRVSGTVGDLLGHSGVSRCQLELRSCSTQNPAYAGKTSKDEVAAALASKEVNCQSVYDGNYPEASWYKEGGWFSDTYTFDFSGCAGLTSRDKPPAYYIPNMPTINVYGPAMLIAKFEVQEAS